MDAIERGRAFQHAIDDLGMGRYGDSTRTNHRSDTNGPCLACDQRNQTADIRITNPYGFRSGEWAQIIGATWLYARPCYTVRFVDGVIDYWPIEDQTAGYEFRHSDSHGT